MKNIKKSHKQSRKNPKSTTHKHSKSPQRSRRPQRSKRSQRSRRPQRSKRSQRSRRPQRSRRSKSSKRSQRSRRSKYHFGEGEDIYQNRFKIISRFVLSEGEFNGINYGRNFVKLEIIHPTIPQNSSDKKYLIFYTSQTSGGFWRIYIPGYDKLDEFNSSNQGHYVMTTFVHLDLQNHINKIFMELPIENIKVEDINTYTKDEFRHVLYASLTQFESLLPLKYSVFLLNPRLNFLPGFVNSFKDHELQQEVKNLQDAVTNIWKNDTTGYLIPVTDRYTVAYDLLYPEKRREIESLINRFTINYFNTYFTPVNNVSTFNFKFLDHQFNFGNLHFIQMYQQDFIDRQGKLFRLYSAGYHFNDFGYTNIAFVPLIPDVPITNYFGGYQRSVNPGYLIYKIFDYKKQYPYVSAENVGNGYVHTKYPLILPNVSGNINIE